MTTLQTSNKLLTEFLVSMDYKNKSLVSPTKILKHIPEKYHCYFWHGFLDGDGAPYISKNPAINRNSHLSSYKIWGSFEQNWEDLLNLMKNLNIETKIIFYEREKPNGKIHRSSCINISKNKGILTLVDYIYNSNFKGLNRKYETCMNLKKYITESKENGYMRDIFIPLYQ